jgi:hypothetical protein
MHFFVLNETPTGSNEEARVDVLDADGTNHGDASRCESCGEYVGMREWLPPYRVELDLWGREFGDVAPMLGDDLLVSERFKALWQRSGLSGLSDFAPVEVVKVRRHRRLKLRAEPPPYFRAAVTHSRTTIDFAASGFEWDNPPTCMECRLARLLKRWNRVIIDQATWNGEDVFVARGLPGTVIVSRRFKEWCEDHAIKNAVFIPAEEYAYDFYPWEKQNAPRER